MATIEDPSVTVSVNSITVKRGEVLTVWLRTDPGDGNYRAVQVELRVTPEGRPEVFSNDAYMTSFDNWTMQRGEHKDGKE